MDFSSTKYNNKIIVVEIVKYSRESGDFLAPMFNLSVDHAVVSMALLYNRLIFPSNSC